MSAPPFDAMPEADVRRRARELTHENRRLRAILDALAKAGLGTGATLEVMHDGDPNCSFLGFVVCRPDRDEMEFLADVSHAAELLAQAVKEMAAATLQRPVSEFEVGEPYRTGVTRLATEGDENP